MKKTALLPFGSRPSGMLIGALLACGAAPWLGATEHVFGTGSSMPALATGDTVKISGNAGVVTLSDSTALTVSDQAETSTVFSVGDAGGVTFTAAKATGDWAVLQRIGAAGLISVNAAASGTNILNLNKMILQGASTSAISLGESGAANGLLINGDVVFRNNLVTNNGAAVSMTNGSLLGFSGSTVIFDSNKSTGAGGGIYVGSGAAEIMFQNGARFINNEAASGGGISTTTATSGRRINIKVGDGATLEFSNNRATTGNGGAINNAGSTTPAGASISGGNLVFANNSAGGTGGAIRSSVGIYIENASFAFLHNQSTGAGGAFNATNLTLLGSGTLSGNVTAATGGAYHSASTNAVVNIDSAAGDIVFDGNMSAGLGGAINMFAANATVTLSATGAGNIIFKNNKANATIDGALGAYVGTGGDANAIHYNGATPGSLVLNAGAGNSIEFYDPVSSAAGTLAVTKDGGGTALFDGYHTDIAANTAVNAGVFRVTGGAIYGKGGAGAFALAGGATLSGSNGEIRAATIDLATGAILEAAGGGALKLSAGAITGASGLTLAGSGTIDAGATPLNAAAIRVGESNGSAAETLAIAGGVELADGATVHIDLFDAGASDKLTAATLTLGASGTIDIGGLDTGSYTIATTTGGITGAATGFGFKTGGNDLSNRLSASLAVSSNDLILSTTVRNLRMGWAGGDGVWVGGSGGWLEVGPPTTPETRFLTGDSALFNTTGTTVVTVAGEGVTAADVSVALANATDTLTFTGGTIVTDTASANASGTAAVGAGKVYLDGGATADATGKLTKSGAGTLVLANEANSFQNGIDIAEGTLAFSKAAQLAVGGGTSVNFTGDATLRAEAAILNATGTLAANIAIAASKTATFDTQAYDVAYAGVLSGDSTVRLVKSGSGALTLHAADSSLFAGGVQVDAGQLLLANNARLGGAVTVGAGAVAGGVGEFGGNVTLTNGTLRVGGGSTNSGTLTIGGTLTLDNSRVALNLFAGEASDVLAFGSSGTLVLAGSNIVDFHPTESVSGTFFVTSATSLKGALITVDGETIGGDSRQKAIWADVIGGIALDYGVDTSRVMTWTGSAGDGIWASDGSKNWLGSESKERFLNGDAVNFSVAASGSVAITGADVRVASMDVAGGGNLTIGGLGIVASGSFATGTEVSGSSRATGRLAKSGAGTLVFQNTTNTFEGGIDIAGGLVAFNKAAQLAVGSGAVIQFTGNATLRADADITTGFASAITIAAATVATFDTQGYNVTYTGTLGGSGTLAKTGAGTLVYAGGVSLGGDATTRIDNGLVKLNIAPATAPNVEHTFDLNGGWLDLSDTGFDTTGSTANNWEKLTLIGDAGGVIGGNDRITLGAGEVGFAIGAVSGSTKQGVFVVVDAGAGGVATMSTANNYAGYTMIKSGTLRISNDNQLGLAGLNREVVFAGAGAALEITADGFSTNRAVELRQNGVVSVAGAATATWNGAVTETGGSFKLIKGGAGTLILGGTLQHTGGIEVASGTLRASVAGLRGPVTNNAALVLEQASGIGVYSGTVTGAGVVTKAGAGALVLDSTAVINGSRFDLDAGVLAGVGRINARLVNKASAQILGAKAAGGAGYGTLTIGGDYVGEGGTITLGVLLQDTIALNADRLVITGSATGTTLVSLVTTGTSGMDASGGNTPLIDAQGGSAGDAFALDRRYVSGLYEFNLGRDSATGEWSLAARETPPENHAVMGVDATALLIGKASFSSLGSRLMFARATPTEHKFELWMNGLQRHDKIVSSGYNGTKTDVYGVQVGGDWTRAWNKSMLSAGVFYDYANSEMDLPEYETAPEVLSPGGSTDGESHAAGVYFSYRAGPWYADAIARGAREDYRVNIFRTPEFKMKGTSYAASVGTGVTVSIDPDWKFEPEARLTWQTHRVDDTRDSFGRLFRIDSADSLEGRFSLRLWEDLEWRQGLRITPYIRGSVFHEFKGEGQVLIDGAALDNDLGGGGGAVDAGFSMQLGRGCALNASGEWYIGGMAEGYGLNLGFSCAW
ncbi:autotransporter outer membrane beta-barrel domain-containing protein [Termitidicoccus mucosus]|uniref:Autotransporter domain-containing protein n=1 Tax=Termitidicoccus mucosus TaxID=1184151 RepID=A0A178IL34_9BACT|nr:hypothetical protein AW736_11315 [Opitutaceae bacterium TSB47]